MKRFFSYLICFICMMSTVLAFAEVKALIKEYTYQASELDSKTSCRAIAIEQVKRELLEELGTYVESTTVVKDFQIEKDEIKTLSAGVVQTKILDEKWDGRDYWLKAEVSADPDEVAASIEKLRTDSKLAEELAEARQEKEDALGEVERLKKDLANAEADKEKLEQYNQAVNQLQASDSFEQGTAMKVAGDYEGAARAYDRAIDLRPDNAKAYFNRSIVYIYLGDYGRATSDLDRAMVIRPANTNAYYQRAAAYKDIREKIISYQTRKSFPLARRPFKPVPTNDPLQKFLERKQTENKLVRVNPFQPKPRLRQVDRPGVMQPHVQRPTLDRNRPLDLTSPSHINRNKPLQPLDRPRVTPPQGPDVRKPGKLVPPAADAKQPISKPHVEPVKKKTLKELLEEKKRKQP